MKRIYRTRCTRHGVRRDLRDFRDDEARSRTRARAIRLSKTSPRGDVLSRQQVHGLAVLLAGVLSGCPSLDEA
ncbi:hypothetical protein FKP32DRAFT_579686 [Trametes sanguinea]|nr:hypothetical protein FKP32DRAFT_579686 [Trametes sanguinea]